jgi:hypothetical protein
MLKYFYESFLRHQIHLPSSTCYQTTQHYLGERRGEKRGENERVLTHAWDRRPISGCIYIGAKDF